MLYLGRGNRDNFPYFSVKTSSVETVTMRGPQSSAHGLCGSGGLNCSVLLASHELCSP